MSYSIIDPCHNCDENKTCTDLKVINDAVQNGIHTKIMGQDGHEGSGYISTMRRLRKIKLGMDEKLPEPPKYGAGGGWL